MVSVGPDVGVITGVGACKTTLRTEPRTLPTTNKVHPLSECMRRRANIVVAIVSNL